LSNTSFATGAAEKRLASRVEEQVRERFRGFAFRQAVVHRPVEVSRELRDLP
jgi:hypothetical protein